MRYSMEIPKGLLAQTLVSFGLGKKLLSALYPDSHITPNQKPMEKLMTKNVLNKLGFLGAVLCSGRGIASIFCIEAHLLSCRLRPFPV